MPPQKRKAATAHDAQANKKQKSVTDPIVGGLNGDYRITGEDTSSDFLTFKVETVKDDKVIPCQERRPRPLSSPINPGDSLLIFTHGAGGGLENPATKHFADGYGMNSAVVCFQGTMNLQSRVKNFETVLEQPRAQFPKQKLAVGGRSMGARAAVIVAQDHEEIEKLVLVSYPLKGQGGDLRDQILCDLPKDKEVLFLVGSEDGMCGLEELKKVRKRMKAKTCVAVVKGADHGMSLKLTGKGLGKEEKEKIVEEVRRETGRLAAKWVENTRAVADGTSVDWEELNTGDETKGNKGQDENVGKEDADAENPADVQEKATTSGSRRSKRRKK